MTRSHKWTDRDHAGIADGTAERESKLPRYFAKQGHADADPTKTKKDGSGKGNWYVELFGVMFLPLPIPPGQQHDLLSPNLAYLD